MNQIVQDTWIQSEDVIAALKEMPLLEPDMTSGDVAAMLVLSKDRLKSWAELHGAPLLAPVSSSAFTEIPKEEVADRVQE